MTRFEPVRLPPDRALNKKVSATFLRHFNMCARSGYLYAKYKGEAATPAMARGTCFHEVRARSAAIAVDSGELTIPSEIVKVVLDEALAEFHVPFEEHDYLREAVARWSSEAAFPPADRVLANETLFVLDVHGWQVRCRIDWAEALDDGAAVLVEDHKTARALVPYEEIARKRPDGSLAAKNMQLVLYALVLAFGVPVRVEECQDCDGDGFETFLEYEPGRFCPVDQVRGTLMGDEPRFDRICVECDGKGRIETPEPFPVAARAQRFDLSFVYPGIEDADGRMARRTVTLTRIELEEYRASLEGLVARVASSEAVGHWPAQTSDEGCSICPARPECPIPVEVRDHRGVVNTPQEAAEAAERLAYDKDDHQARHKELRLWAKANGGRVRFGADRVMEFVYGRSERWDRDGLLAAADRRANYGEPYDREAFVKRSDSTAFKVRTLTAAELGEEAAQATEEEGSR